MTKIQPRAYTLEGFKQIYKNDILEIFKILSKDSIDNKYQITDKENLFKQILEYIYIHSDTLELKC